MSYSQSGIYTLALSALMLSKEVTEIDTDKSNEVRVLNIFWPTALESTLKDLNIDILSSSITLELIEEITDGGPWKYAYKYPSKCALLRKLKSCVVTDTRSTHLPKVVEIYKGQKAILTNEYQAIAKVIPTDVPLAAFSSMAALALAYNLAWLSAPLIAGKGAKTLKEEIYKQYLVFKAEAQEDDAVENFNYESDATRSEFVAARMS